MVGRLSASIHHNASRTLASSYVFPDDSRGYTAIIVRIGEWEEEHTLRTVVTTFIHHFAHKMAKVQPSLKMPPKNVKQNYSQKAVRTSVIS
jgi:hypothetical protein